MNSAFFFAKPLPPSFLFNAAITSGGASVASDITSGAGSVGTSLATVVTSGAGGVATTITSGGGSVVSQASKGATDAAVSQYPNVASFWSLGAVAIAGVAGIGAVLL